MRDLTKLETDIEIIKQKIIDNERQIKSIAELSGDNYKQIEVLNGQIVEVDKSIE